MKSLVPIIIFLLFSISIAMATNLNVKILKISAEEQAVVIKQADDKLTLLKVGDMIDGEKRIVGFEGDRVVLEGPGEWGPVRYVVDVSAGQMHITSMARRPIETYVFRGKQ